MSFVMKRQGRYQIRTRPNFKGLPSPRRKAFTLASKKSNNLWEEAMRDTLDSLFNGQSRTSSLIKEVSGVKPNSMIIICIGYDEIVC